MDQNHSTFLSKQFHLGKHNIYLFFVIFQNAKTLIPILSFLRIISGIGVAFWVYVTPLFKDSNNEYPFYYYIVCLFITSIHSIFTYAMFVSQMSFFSKISDKKIGGTYMTFLNTISNMGYYYIYSNKIC
jgi:hypothetical protein